MLDDIYGQTCQYSTPIRKPKSMTISWINKYLSDGEIRGHYAEKDTCVLFEDNVIKADRQEQL